MLGPIGSEIMGIFRLLSPHEIDRYIIDTKEESVGATMKMAANGEPLQYNDEKPHFESPKNDHFPKEHSAKIIPLKTKQSQETHQTDEQAVAHLRSDRNDEEVEQIQVHQDSSGSSLASVGILSSKAIKEQEQKRLKEENDKKDSTTVFLLKEREKARLSKRRLTEMYAMKSYQSTANQDFSGEYEEDDDGNRVSDNMKGILLNKKQS